MQSAQIMPYEFADGSVIPVDVTNVSVPTASAKERQDIYVTLRPYRPKRRPVTRCCMYFTISKPTRISHFHLRPPYTCRISCVQQFCMRCESEPDIDKGCEQCGKRKHAFWDDDPVGDLLTYLCRPRPWANKIVAIAHNAKAFDLHFVLNRAILLKWQPEMIINGQMVL
jgi:hypothetical protein